MIVLRYYLAYCLDPVKYFHYIVVGLHKNIDINYKDYDSKLMISDNVLVYVSMPHTIDLINIVPNL